MWQHSQICCHGMPQTVVLRTKRDRGLSYRGATLHGSEEQQSYAKRQKKEVLRIFCNNPFLSKWQCPFNCSSQLRHTCTHSCGSHHLQEDVIRCFGRCLAHTWPLLRQSAVPAVVPVFHPSWIRITSGPQALNLPMKTRTLVVTNSPDPEAGPLIQPNKCFLASSFVVHVNLKY